MHGHLDRCTGEREIDALAHARHDRVIRLRVHAVDIVEQRAHVQVERLELRRHHTAAHASRVK